MSVENTIFIILVTPIIYATQVEEAMMDDPEDKKPEDYVDEEQVFHPLRYYTPLSTIFDIFVTILLR